MKEFAFYKGDIKDAVLGDEIEIFDDCIPENLPTFLVSNSPKIKAQIYAPEIDFYIKNSSDDFLQKSKSVSLMYEARAVCFDLAKDLDYQKSVGKNVILISDENRENLANLLKKHEFKVILLNHSEVNFLYGQVGEIVVQILQNNEEIEVTADFALIENAKDFMLRQSGCYEIANLSNEQILQILNEKSPEFRYKNSITYDSQICDYHHRRDEICAKCSEICPTVAILKDDENKELVFSHIDCIGCGRCVGICPTGAIDSAKMPRNAFLQVAKLYENKKILIIPQNLDLQDLSVKLPQNTLILSLYTLNFLSLTHFLTLLQTSGANLAIFDPQNSADGPLCESIDIINQIYELKFKTRAVSLIQNQNELESALSNLQFIENSKFNLVEANLSKLEIFSKRLSFLVGNDNLGVVKSGKFITHGKISINENSCTLCLSCAGACNTGALFADANDNSLKYNASLCTACGYCVKSCAEKDTINLQIGQIELKPEYFSHQILAKDSLFACIECGKEFAPSKAVMKIAEMMMSKISDPVTQKTLYCCGDCKAKIMIQKMHEQKDI